MSDTAAILEAEQQFFSALTDPNVPELEQVLADDFTLVALNGAVLDRASLTAAVESGHLKFNVIRVIESVVRFYEPLAVVVGRTEMSGSLGDTPFTASSRYTHVYALQGDWYRLVAGQGTPIAPD